MHAPRVSHPWTMPRSRAGFHSLVLLRCIPRRTATIDAIDESVTTGETPLMHRSAVATFAALLFACSGAVEAEPASCPAPDASPLAADASAPDVAADAAPADPCLETAEAIAACARGGAPYGWATSAECTGTPTRMQHLRTIARPDGRACCEESISSFLCCPETCQ